MIPLGKGYYLRIIDHYQTVGIVCSPTGDIKPYDSCTYEPIQRRACFFAGQKGKILGWGYMQRRLEKEL